MLYDLNWLAPGQTFPPLSEIPRLAKYRDNQLLFEGDFDKVLSPYVRRILNITQNYQHKTICQLGLNYHELVTLKTGDLVCGEPPEISVKDEAKNKKLKKLLDDTDFFNKLTKGVYGVSIKGDTPAMIISANKSAGETPTHIFIDPAIWFPVVNSFNIEQKYYDVLAWVEGEDEKKQTLKVQIHEKGKYRTGAFRLTDGSVKTLRETATGGIVNYRTYKIGALIEDWKEFKTGLDDFAVIHLSNITTPYSIYGIDDYSKLTPIIAELQVRYTVNQIILDKHSMPDMYAPSSAFTKREDGSWSLAAGGNTFIVEEGDTPPGYITWNGSLAENHAHIERLEKHLYSLSEMGAVINDDSFGASQGYEALVTRMTNARLKARRLTTKLTNPIKKLVTLLCKANGIDIKQEDISIYWNDGIPNSEFTDSRIVAERIAAGTISRIDALQEYYGKSLEEAEEIAQRVQDERAENSMLTAFGQGEPL